MAIKTEVRFSIKQGQVRQLVAAPALALLPIWTTAEDKNDAVEAVFCAFWNADSSAGNGITSNGSATKGKFRAEANVTSEEFELYMRLS